MADLGSDSSSSEGPQYSRVDLSMSTVGRHQNSNLNNIDDVTVASNDGAVYRNPTSASGAAGSSTSTGATRPTPTVTAGRAPTRAGRTINSRIKPARRIRDRRVAGKGTPIFNSIYPRDGLLADDAFQFANTGSGNAGGAAPVGQLVSYLSYMVILPFTRGILKLNVFSKPVRTAADGVVSAMDIATVEVAGRWVTYLILGYCRTEDHLGGACVYELGSGDADATLVFCERSELSVVDVKVLPVPRGETGVGRVVAHPSFLVVEEPEVAGVGPSRAKHFSLSKSFGCFESTERPILAGTGNDAVFAFLLGTPFGASDTDDGPPLHHKVVTVARNDGLHRREASILQVFDAAVTPTPVLALGARSVAFACGDTEVEDVWVGTTKNKIYSQGVFEVRHAISGNRTNLCTVQAGHIRALAFNPDCTLIAVATDEGLARGALVVFRLMPNAVPSTGGVPLYFCVGTNASTRYLSVRFSNDSKWLAVADQGGGKVYAIVSPEGGRPTQQTHLDREFLRHNSAGEVVGDTGRVLLEDMLVYPDQRRALPAHPAAFPHATGGGDAALAALVAFVPQPTTSQEPDSSARIFHVTPDACVAELSVTPAAHTGQAALENEIRPRVVALHGEEAIDCLRKAAPETPDIGFAHGAARNQADADPNNRNAPAPALIPGRGRLEGEYVVDTYRRPVCQTSELAQIHMCKYKAATDPESRFIEDLPHEPFVTRSGLDAYNAKKMLAAIQSRLVDVAAEDEPIYDLSKSVFVRNNTGSVSLSRSIINGAGGFGARDDGAPGTSQR